jgi:hypothetical protein
MPAIDRYDGPMWQTLRAGLAELPAARDAVASGELLITALSARHGFIRADVAIEDYDRRLTETVAAEICRDPSYDHHQMAMRFAAADQVLFAGGAIYRDTMWKASNGGLAHIMKVAETDGPGIGIHRAQIGAWLQLHYGEQPALALAA